MKPEESNKLLDQARASFAYLSDKLHENGLKLDRLAAEVKALREKLEYIRQQSSSL